MYIQCICLYKPTIYKIYRLIDAIQWDGYGYDTM